MAHLALLAKPPVLARKHIQLVYASNHERKAKQHLSQHSKHAYKGFGALSQQPSKGSNSTRKGTTRTLNINELLSGMLTEQDTRVPALHEEFMEAVGRGCFG